jgi:mono/diheme cytochrome c family protein/cytochrome c553
MPASFHRTFALCVALLVSNPGTRAAASDPALDHFERRIRPLFAEHCLGCHGDEKQEAGLRLDSREALLKGGETGAAVVPGKPEESLLLATLLHREPAPKMPRKKPPLPAAAIADVRQWIAAGAPWPAGGTAAKAGFDLAERKRRLPWLWQTPQRQPVPREGGTAGSDVDAFLGQRLREAGLQPAPPTDDRTWLRRVHFVITGLPPTPEETAQFVQECAEEQNLGGRNAGRQPSSALTNARARAVDRLLASPHFGERWARHWMDVVRYAESRGHEDDFVIANAWRYRDYLIRAFNADVPYDRFVAEHVAGDLLPPRRNPTTGGNESVLGPGWAFLGEEVHSPVDIRQDECERVDNKVDVLSKAFLGLTVACARCHDHKFDAVTQRDYYALSGFILSSPYRQVRYETAEAEARTARQLAELRAQHAGGIAAAFAKSVEPGVRSAAALLNAVRQQVAGEPSAGGADLPTERTSAWREQLQAAETNANHVLHPLALALRASVSGKQFAIPTRAPESLRPKLPEDARVQADFTVPNATTWRTDGPVFGNGVRAAGEVVLGQGNEGIARVMPFGAASRDHFWDRLALTPGTEMDSGTLGAAGRAGKNLLTPKFTLKSGKLHYLLRGKAQAYAGVDSHIMVNGPLHGRLTTSFDTGASLRWVTQDLSEYVGHRAHVEFAPKDQTDLDVLLVVESVEVPKWLPVTAWLPAQSAKSFAEVAAAFENDLAEACAALAGGKAAVPVGLAPLADWLVRNEALFGAPGGWANAATEFHSELAKIEGSVRWDSPTAVSWTETSGVDEHILLRGKPGKPAAAAPRGLPEALGLPAINPAEFSGRRELAGQLTDPANPLVARVFVNRVWHHVFGRGLVPTVDNFGYLGERPTHPELLDHLAWAFIHEDGWSLKRLLRRLVLTEAFARSSRGGDVRAEEVDPINRLLHRMPVRRLEGEAIRDALLTVSGRLNPAQFGLPVPVHLTEFIVGRGRPGSSGPLDGAGRRSLYTAVRRNFLPTMMVAFDYPTPFSTVGKRNVTNVPGQSLVMMNDPFVREQAGLWAARLLRELPGGTDAARVNWLFETAFARSATTEEQAFARDSLAELRTLHAGAAEHAVWAEFGHALLNANEFIYLR